MKEDPKFVRTMSESKLPHRLPLKHKNISDITHSKMAPKPTKQTLYFESLVSSLIESKSSSKNDTYIVSVKSPGKNG